MVPRLRIAQVAPLYEAVPPATYGGTELVVHAVTDELVRRGHDVTLFASGDSRTRARLRAGSPVALWSSVGRALPATDVAALERAHYEAPHRDPGGFDVIHDHADVGGLRAAVEHESENVLVTHHRQVDETVVGLLASFRGGHNAVSAAAAATFPPTRQVPPVHHGIEVESYTFRERPEDYLLFLGRFSREKGPGTAVRVARRSGSRLVLAGRINPQDRETFERDVRPYLDDRIRYVGEADAVAKRRLLAGARALLFPITWDEPFGLVMIEALSSGTPIVATRRASTPEIVDDGETGLLGGTGDGSEADVEAIAELLPRVPELSRRRCREVAAARFTVAHMVDEYERRYATVLGLADPPMVDGDLVREPRSP